MNVERLVTMANEIAAFFASEQDQDAAAEQVAGHLKRFWEPRMRREIVAYVDGGGTGLEPIAREAVSRLKG